MTTTCKMPDIDIKQLIIEVKRRPVLWDSTHPEYNHRQSKLSAWEEVAINLSEDALDWSNYEKFGKVKEMQKRWENIKEIYAKEIRYERKVEEGSAQPRKRKYPYSHLLDFLLTPKKCKSIREKENVLDRESVAVQTTPPRVRAINEMTLSFLENPSLAFINGPNTPSPIPKSNMLEAADHLLSVAERGFAVMESKLPENIASNINSARNTNNALSARKTMTDYTTSPTKGSVFSDYTLQSRSKTSYNVPQNSPCTSCKHSIEDKYKKNNGEKKSVKPKNVGSSKASSNSSKSRPQSVPDIEKSINLGSSPAITQFSMFYEQQQLVERKLQNAEENNSATVVFKSGAKVISSTKTAVKQDVETSTDPEFFFQPKNILRNTQNSSIISMKTSKPEQEDLSTVTHKKTFNVQRMPSVNIRPEFTIQHGPKINIAASSSNFYKPKRKNTEFFDVVYPPSSPVLYEPSIVVESERQLKLRDNQHVCERHVFPSGKLISGSQGIKQREEKAVDNLSTQDKKHILLNLIRTVTEKIEKQASNEKKNCCRLICSLPLLASVVNKIQVNCVSCVGMLHRHLDKLVRLMEEELRSPKELSEDHCCLLDETVQYLIVELELIQEENTKRQPSEPDVVSFVRHQGNEGVKLPKKTVSFESISSAISTQIIETPIRSQINTNKSTVKEGLKTKNKPVLLKSQQPKTPKYKTSLSNNVLTDKIKNQSQLQQLRTKIGNNVTSIPSKPKKTENVSKITKENTVVGQVMKHIMNSKPILKNVTTSEKSPAENLQQMSSSNSNAFYKIVDKKETSNEFDEWVENRSQKIKLIHEELYKMISGSIDNLVKTSTTDNPYSHMSTECRYEYQENKNSRINSKEKEDSMTSSQNEERKESQLSKADPTVQETNQEYAEDFEDDIEEAFCNKSVSSEDSHQYTLAEVDNGTSPSSDNGEGARSENLEASSEEDEQSIAGFIPSEKNEDVQNMPITNLKGTSADILTISKETQSEVEESNHKPFTVDVATSPINLKLPGESSLSLSVAHYASSKSKVEKVSIATSPIITHDKEVASVKSTTVQTDPFDTDITKKQGTGNCLKRDDMKLTVPSAKLQPTSLQNSLQVTLNSVEDNSVAFQANPPNQTVNLYVQLPDLLGKTNEQKNTTDMLSVINEIKSDFSVNSDKPKQDSEARIERSIGSVEKTAVSSKSNHKIVCTEDELTFDNVQIQKGLTEKSIKDIIEPTVSEVLKKFNVPSTSTANNADAIEGLVVMARSNPQQLQLLKPNVILQTRHSQWQECDLVAPAKQVVDSSNQTEAEKQNVHTQAAPSLVGSMSEKSISVIKPSSSRGEFETSYLKMLQPPLPRAETVTSSMTYSSTCRSSTRSSSSSSSARSKGEHLNNMGKLSEGEVGLELCSCVVGEVCPICVPKLDLSFGELKTKRRNKKRENFHLSDSDSELSGNLRSGFSLSKVPLHLEPRPNSAHLIASLTGFDPSKTETTEHLKEGSEYFPLDKYSMPFSRFSGKTKEPKSVSKQFSEIAKSVINDLNMEYLRKSGGTQPRNHSYQNVDTNISKERNVIPLNKQFQNDSSSDSMKSYASSNSKCLQKNKSKTRKPLVIKSPTEKAKIDVVIEGSDVSASSYQTSVTSVSVENIPVFSSHSSDELQHSS